MTEESKIDELNKNTEEKSLSTRLQSLLEKPELLEKMIAKRPSWLETLDDDTPASVIAGNLIASALTGDKKSIELIQRIAYGDKVSIDVKNPGFFDREKLVIEIVDPKHKEEIDETE